MKTEFLFWSGLDTIGGNIIEIRYGNDRVIFDFGRQFNPEDVLLHNAKGREKTRVSDMLRLKMIPAIDGIYNQESLRGIELISAEASDLNTGIFISHLHLDHMGAIDTVSSQIPVYMSEESKKLYAELIKIEEPPFKPLNEIKSFTFEEPVWIGAIKVIGYQIDHDVFGASSIVVKTPDASFCYSGDIRMHGQNPELNHQWMQKMQALNVDYLLMEGTTFQPPHPEFVFKKQVSEQEIPELMSMKLKEFSGIGFFNFYNRNIDRMKNLILAAEQSGRQIVFEPKTAQLLSAFLPKENILVLKTASTITTPYPTVTIDKINEAPDSYFVQNSFENIFNLMDYHLENSVYIHSNGVPLGNYDPAYSSMLSFLEKLGITFETMASSGHASQDAILEMIDRIKPKTLIPWHSKNPEQMSPLDSNQEVLRPTLNHWY